MKFVELLKEAQFHGAIRLADSKYRWYWAVALFIFLLCSLSNLYDMIIRYLDSPTYLLQVETVANFMRFPSVLVCPEVNFPDYKMDAFVDEIRFPSTLNKSYVRTILQQLAAFYSPDVVYTTRDLQKLEKLLSYNELDVETAGRMLTSSCEETLIRCRWAGEIVNCSTIFQMELSAYGFCCVFNGRSLNRELKEFGIHRVKPQNRWYTSQTGFTSALMIAVNQSQMPTNVDLSYKWIAVVGGQRYVDSTINGTPISPGTEMWAAYGYKRLRVSDDAKSLSSELRRCHLADEPLKYFPIYHENYCLLECEISRTLHRCHCVRVAHPKPPGAVHCHAKSLLCARHAAVSFSMGQCHCPYTCDTDSDQVVMQSYNLTPNSHPYDVFYNDLDFDKVSVVRAYIRTHERKMNIRRPYFNSYDLFSQLGGIFNVFFGCSILTMLELAQLLWYGLRNWWSSKPKDKKDKLNLRLSLGKRNRIQISEKKIENKEETKRKRKITFMKE